ncbi:MAG TPA: phage tail protein [Longimicrobium sp.]|jgi:phage tail-like protein
MSGERAFPYVSYKFLVEIESSVAASFSEASGIQVETEVEEYQEGGVNGFRHRLAKGSKYGTLVLKRGLVHDDALWKWHKDVVDGKVQRKNVSLILWNTETSDQAWRWTFRSAFPVKWAGPDLKGDANTVAVETLELVHDGFIDSGPRGQGGGT